MRWPRAACVPEPVVTVLLEAATLCDALQWALVPAFSLILYTWLWGAGVTVLLLTQFPHYLWWCPIHPTHTLANNPFGKETLKYSKSSVPSASCGTLADTNIKTYDEEKHH